MARISFCQLWIPHNDRSIINFLENAFSDFFHKPRAASELCNIKIHVEFHVQLPTYSLKLCNGYCLAFHLATMKRGERSLIPFISLMFAIQLSLSWGKWLSLLENDLQFFPGKLPLSFQAVVMNPFLMASPISPIPLHPTHHNGVEDSPSLIVSFIRKQSN